MKVSNKKCIRRLSIQHMKSAKTRNVITILAIALTTILFTALFTAGMSIKYGYEQSNFRQAGGYCHGSFKGLTREQYEELQGDPLIRERGERLFLGMPEKAPFLRNHVELSYCNGNTAKWMFLKPKEGRLPQEGTDEAAADATVLKLLGVEPVIGSAFTITFMVDGTETTQTFTLCGYWEHDDATYASHVLLPKSRVEGILEELDTQGNDGLAGFWTMDVMFRNSVNIADKMKTVLERHGYQNDEANKERYISTGVNWGYINSQVSSVADDPMTALAILAAVVLIIFTGYLIIYNIFQISVSGDVRFYGLLKTIGTTGRQIKKLILIQALALSVVGIPLGELIGYSVGMAITHVAVSGMSLGIVEVYSISPLIFLGAAAFSEITVLLSCRKPRRMAARISPIEALRYTEGAGSRKKIRKAAKGASVFKMAWANLGRNRGKTVVTVISLSLSIVILNLTYMLTTGFDMDRYIRDMSQDFVLASSTHYQKPIQWEDVAEDVADDVAAQEGVVGGRTYGKCSHILELAPEEGARAIRSDYMRSEEIDYDVSHLDRAGDFVADRRIQLYGMEDFVLDKLTLVEGDLSKIKEGGRYIAAVYKVDDYNDIIPHTLWAGVGDKVTLRYVDRTELYNPSTGYIYQDYEEINGRLYAERVVEYTDVEYEVCALVIVPRSLNYGMYGNHEYVMGADIFRADTGTDSILYYAFDCDDDCEDAMEEYLRQLTENDDWYDYRSKQTYAESFNGLRNTFVIVGATLSFVIGLIGILNFLNAVLTSIFARKKEFAVLQSVGMTGRQLNLMLGTEGVVFAGSSVVITLVLTVAMGSLTGSLLERMFWFFSYRFTIVPVLAVAPAFWLLGVAIPLAAYRYVVRRSIVERLREAE